MAFGVGNASGNMYNNNSSKTYNPSVFSRYTFNNPNGDLDKTSLRFGHFGGLLKISIVPVIPGSQNEYDQEHAVSLHLSPSKAYMFLKEIERFQEDFASGKMKSFSYGVDTPKGLLCISDGTDLGKPGNPCLIIRKMEDSNVVESYAYQFKNNGYYYSIRSYDDKTGKFDKKDDIYNDLEIEFVKTQLKEYIKAMTMSVAYSVVEATKYNENNVYNSLNQIKTAHGIETNRRRSGGTSYFRDGGETPRTSYQNVSSAMEDGDYESEI